MVYIALIFVKSIFVLINAESVRTLVVSFHKMTFFNTSRSFDASLNPGQAGPYNQPLRLAQVTTIVLLLRRNYPIQKPSSKDIIFCS